MEKISTTLKDNVSTIIGFLVMVLSFLCYFFDWPQQRDVVINSIEFSAGIVLVFMPVEKIAIDLWNLLKIKLSGNKG